MKEYRLTDQFRDPGLERAVLGALSENPQLYWELVDTLSPGTFSAEAEVWEKLSAAMEKDDPTEGIVPGEWEPSAQPQKDGERLADLHQRRLLAGAQERLAEALHDGNVPAAELAQRLEGEAARAQAAIRELESGRVLYASELVGEVLADARQRVETRRETGKAVMGVGTGIEELDNITGGMVEGLYLLAAGPGVGKTTLALQKAVAAARQGVPAIYVTFENSPANLVLKIICARTGTNTRDVMRGYADPGALAEAAGDLGPILAKIAVVEGSGRLGVGQLRARALQAMNRSQTENCLVVVDYMQLWAKASAELRGFASVRERVEALAAELRQLATRLKNPVLAVASQNRAGAGVDYRRNGGAPLDSLKESGDLEYAADVVMFLSGSTERNAVAPARAVDLSVAKNRNGEVGKVELIFRPDTGMMRQESAREAAL